MKKAVKLTDKQCSNKIYQRWLVKVDVTTQYECWEWKASKVTAGYGYFSIDGKNIGAHRYAYLYFIDEIPSGFFVCHRCNNPSCVNPRHLYLGDCQRTL